MFDKIDIHATLGSAQKDIQNEEPDSFDVNPGEEAKLKEALEAAENGHFLPEEGEEEETLEKRIAA
ncbi:MAG TPA: hypothetical protein VN420_00180 [Candidatus Fimivivens sp.]|nr:hypothetical protein [Candidatus Fimivivens sp.]